MATLADVKRKIKTDKNGEVEQTELTQTFYRGEEPPYIKLYIQDILYFTDMPPRYNNLINALLKRVSYAGDEYGMCVLLTKPVKKIICKEIGWDNTASVDNAMQELMKGKVVARVERGMYRFNPYLFGRGNWADIAKLRLSVNYDEIHGRTFAANCGIKDKKEAEYWEKINEEV